MAISAPDAAQVASIVAQSGTIGVVRAGLGYVSSVLQQGYDALGQISDSGLQADNRQLLDTVNTNAQLLYGALPPDDVVQSTDAGADVLDLYGSILNETVEALQSIQDATGTNFNFLASLNQAISEYGNQIGQLPQIAAKAAAMGLWTFIKGAWPTLLLIGGAYAAWVFRGPLLRAVARAK